MDKIIEQVPSMNLRYRLNNYQINRICYADDAKIWAETEDNLQRQMYKFDQAGRQYIMTISTEKIKTITFLQPK